MSRSRQLRRAFLGLACAAAACAAFAGPGELTVLSEPSMKGVLTAAAKQFEKESGQHVALLFVKPNQIAATFKGMDHPDLVLLPDDLMERQASHVQADTRRPLGRVGVAVVVKTGVAKPDLSSPDALKQFLGGAKSIVYGEPDANAAGRQAADVIAKLGLTEGLKARTTLSSSANPLSQVDLGAAEVGLHSLHEALETSGVTVVGLVPAPVQSWTRYSIALTAEASNVSEAQRLLQYLAGSSGRALLDAKGVSALP
jgi:molybdate transport system substrate-binding protein